MAALVLRRRSLSPVLLALLGSICLALGALLLAQLYPALGAVAVLLTGLSAFGFMAWATLVDGSKTRRRVCFLHVLVLMSGLSWATFGLTRDYEPYTGLSFLALLTLLQNLVGLLIVVWVAQGLSRRPMRMPPGNLIEYLVTSAQRIPIWLLLAVGALHLALTAYKMSLGMVLSGTGGVMATAGTLQSAVLQVGGILSPVVTCLGWALLFGADPRRKRLGAMLVATQLLLSFFEGRRVLLAVVLLGSLFWAGLRGISLRQAAVSLLSGALVFGLAGPFFLQLRTEALGQGIHTEEAGQRLSTLGESVAKTAETFDPRDPVSQDYAENVKLRAGFYEFSIQVQQRVQDGWPLGLGEFLFLSLAEAVPRFLWQGKLEYLGHLAIEQRLQLWFGLPVRDDNGTFLAFAIADGGWFGVLFYFSILGLTFAALGWFAWNARFLLFRIWAAASLFALGFWIEASVTELFLQIRMLIALVLLDRLLVAVAPRLTEHRRCRAWRRLPIQSAYHGKL